MVENYVPLQGADKAAVLGPFEKRVSDAKSATEKTHAQSDLNVMSGVFALASATVLALPNHPLNPGKLPMTIDLGGSPRCWESHPGHSGADIIVRVPEQNVVYTGDLLFSGWYGVCFDEKATVSGWRETLKKFAALDKDRGTDRFAGKRGSRRSAKYSMTSQDRPKRCTEREFRQKERSTATLYPKNSRIFRYLPGDSRSDRRSRSCTRDELFVVPCLRCGVILTATRACDRIAKIPIRQRPQPSMQAVGD